jgi:hypothetical protein
MPRTILPFLAALSMACATASTEITGEVEGSIPRPDAILVYEFAVTPGEVNLDRGIEGEVAEAARAEPRSVREIQVGHAVAQALSETLVGNIRKLGLPARRAYVPGSPDEDVLQIEGQFVSIDEGNSTERTVIGLGLGRSDVRTHVQVIDESSDTERVALRFATDSHSGRKPGMAETMGAGAAAGNVAMAAVASTGLTVLSEKFSAAVTADAKRTGKSITLKLADFFVEQGWITQAVVEQAFPLEAMQP